MLRRRVSELERRLSDSPRQGTAPPEESPGEKTALRDPFSSPSTVQGALSSAISNKLSAAGDAYAKFLGAIDRGVRLLRNEPDKAYPIVGKYLNAPADDVKGMLSGDKVYDSADNNQLFGTLEKPGSVYATMTSVVDFALKSKLVKAAKAPESMFDPRFTR